MRRLDIVVALLMVSAAAVACAGASGARGGPTAASGAAAERADRNRLTRAEIEAANLPNAYELVSRLRRPWLRRDPQTGAEVAVYMDDQRLGDAEKLRDIPSVEVGELLFLSYDDAVRRYGAAVQGSVIVVVRRR
ncbi:MAG TPA: hypothetical protein VKZ58_07945 [Longimicrobiales bacterium]|nr:hypothetical protein [Longimicrobiales bacterium]